MPKLSVAHELAQPSLFESARKHPRWEDLPMDVRRRVTRLLSELLLNRGAQLRLSSEAEGGKDE
jgi:hypothetical protein